MPQSNVNHQVLKANEPVTRDINVHEARRLLMVAAINDSLHRGESDLRERLGMIPNGWRDWRLALCTVERLLERIYITMPNDQLESHQHALSHSEVHTQLRMISRMPEWVHIKAPDMDMLICLAIQHECRYRLRSDHDVRGCKLRKTLQRIAPPETVPRHGCGYRDMASEYDWAAEGEFND